MKRTLTRTLLLSAMTLGLSVGFALAAGEMAVRLISPQAYLYPRWKYSNAYGHVLYPDTTMIHSMPGRFEFRYRINSLGFRGPLVTPSDDDINIRVVILGDSYAFGTGVQDGDELSAVMYRQLGPPFQTVNLGVGGWGLPQEVRRFFKFGIRYQPRVVILQFCSNDLSDGLRNPVTEVDGREFKFRNTPAQVSWLRARLSNSIVQRSQLYNFLRRFLYTSVDGGPALEEDVVRRARLGMEQKPTAEEAAYLELLSAFAIDLNKRGIALLMISVNGQLESFPALAKGVSSLNEANVLTYIDVRPWFSGVVNYESPEGHLWGTRAHEILGMHLADEVRTVVSGTHADGTT